MRVQTGTWFGNIANGVAVGVAATGASATPNPPNLDPAAWGSEDALWEAAYCVGDDTTTNTYPTNYSGNQTQGNSDTGASAAHLGSCTRALTASSDDPGTFGVAASLDWTAQTIVIRGAAAGGSTQPPRTLHQERMRRAS
jgi:hypothetical protein